MRNCIAILTLLLAGCTAARVGQPLTQTFGGNDLDSQMEFWHQLALRPVTSNDEGFHGLQLYLDNQDASVDYEHRLAALQARGLVASAFSRPADEAISRGTLAVAIGKLLKVRGGVMMSLTGGNVDRYVVRELEFLQIYPQSSENQTFSGSEFVGIIGKIEDYQRGNPADYPASVLPQESSAAMTPPTTQETP